MAVNLMNTIKGSLLEGFFPEGWNLEAWDKCAAVTPKNFDKPKRWWHKQFQPVCCPTLGDFDTMMGHEIAMEIRNARDAKKPLILILPVGPMGMYKWAVYFLKEWGVKCGHVHGFKWTMERSQRQHPAREGSARSRTPWNRPLRPARQFDRPRQTAPLRHQERTARVRPADRRITRAARVLSDLRHRPRLPLAFWEPHFASGHTPVAQWKAAEYRLGARLHPLTIEQNAITSFKSRTTLVPATANTIGPACSSSRTGASARRRRIGRMMAGLSCASRPPPAQPLDHQHVHAHAPRPPLLPRGTGPAARSRVQRSARYPRFGAVLTGPPGFACQCRLRESPRPATATAPRFHTTRSVSSTASCTRPFEHRPGCSRAFAPPKVRRCRQVGDAPWLSVPAHRRLVPDAFPVIGCFEVRSRNNSSACPAPAAHTSPAVHAHGLRGHANGRRHPLDAATLRPSRTSRIRICAVFFSDTRRAADRPGLERLPPCHCPAPQSPASPVPRLPGGARRSGSTGHRAQHDLASSISAGPPRTGAARNPCSIDGIQRPEPPARRGVPVVDPRTPLRGGIRQRRPTYSATRLHVDAAWLTTARNPLRHQHRRGKVFSSRHPMS